MQINPRNHHLTAVRQVLLSFLLILTASVIQAAGNDAGTGVSQQLIGAKRTDIEQAGKLSDEQRQQGLARLDEARALLEEAARLKSENQELQSLIKQVPNKLARIEKGSGLRIAKYSQKQLEQMKADDLEALLSEQERLLQEAQAAVAGKEKQLNNYLTLSRTGSNDLTTLQKKRDATVVESATTSTEPGDLALAEASRLWRDAQRQMLDARIAGLKLQIDNINQLTALAQAERDAHSSDITALNQLVTQLRDALNLKRQAQAEVARKAAQEALQDVPQALKSLQQQISDLTDEHAGLVSRENVLDQQNEHVSNLLTELGRDHERIQYIVEYGGNSAQTSLLLQKRRDFAPRAKSLTSQIINQQQRLSEAVLRQLELDEKLRETSDRDKQIEELLNESIDPATASDTERARLRSIAQDKWSAYRNAMQELWQSYTRYVGKLSTLEANTRQLLQTAKNYRTFINDHLLWMPSTELVPTADLGLLLDTLGWLINPVHLEQLASDAVKTLQEQSSGVVVWFIVSGLLLFLRRRARRLLPDLAQQTKKVRTDNFGVTLLAFGATLLLTLPLPWILVGAGVLLGMTQAASEYTISVAAGLQGIGHTLLLLDWLRQLCRENGLARAHLNWHEELCVNLTRQINWLLPFILPLAFLVSTSAASIPSAFTYLNSASPGQGFGYLAIGRLSFIVMMLLLAMGIYRIWRSDGPLMKVLANNAAGEKWPHYHVLWFVPVLALPLGLALAALAGYFYTAAFLSSMIGETIWFFVVLVLLKDMLLRSLYVTQRRLRFQEALRHREEQLAQRTAATETGATPEPQPIDEEKINYGELSGKVSQLVRMGYAISVLLGLYLIWKDVIPAFGVLNSIELPITTSKLVDGISQDVPLTLGHMIAGLLFGGLALFAARHVPALLELTLLQGLPLSRASRYALTTMTQYIVAMIGVFITFKTLGLQWSSIQWLVAALSVGLGFGLQEIVANFVSGIILLFEQPIRVGDVVTVEGTSGTVARIRIRATTIVNWERQELVIPNKSFITGQLINWTLSDTVNRVIINVGVAYGSDTRKAMQLIGEAAAEHPKVLKDPAPRITFEGFGDNTLNLVLRAYLDDIDARLPTITELHQAINDKFEQADIVIAFPQRDVHLDTSSPLELVLRRAPGDDKTAD